MCFVVMNGHWKTCKYTIHATIKSSSLSFVTFSFVLALASSAVIDRLKTVICDVATSRVQDIAYHTYTAKVLHSCECSNTVQPG